MKLDEMTSPDIERLGDDVVALLPIAATEQHGQHLPLQVDCRITEAIAARVEATRSGWLAVAPTLWIGASHHHLAFGGTMSVPNALYIDLLMAMVDGALNAGFRRIAMLNGHGGNRAPMEDALVRVRQRVGSDAQVHLVGFTYWDLASKRMKDEPGMASPRITHACEYETSMMLHLAGDLVHMDRARAGQPALPSEYYDIAFTRPSRVFAAFNMDQLTAGTGAMGEPEQATAEKGAKLLDVIADEVGKFLDEFRGWPFVPGRGRDR
jgi:creatinine amidohydrolase